MLDITSHKAQHVVCFNAPASLMQSTVVADVVPQSHDVTPGKAFFPQIEGHPFSIPQ